MNAVRAKNRINVAINQNFIIRVIENHHQNNQSKLTSANKLSNYLKDEKLKIKLFQTVLTGKQYKYTFKIRNRLKIDFVSK